MNGVNFAARIAIGLTPKPIPARRPDHRIKIKVSPIETLIYRLNGDYNQLHVGKSGLLKALYLLSISSLVFFRGWV